MIHILVFVVPLEIPYIIKKNIFITLLRTLTQNKVIIIKSVELLKRKLIILQAVRYLQFLKIKRQLDT